MLSHFLKVTVRSLAKRGLLSSLNIGGLSIGIASFLVIALYVFQETSYEKSFADNSRIFRLEEHFLSMGRLAWTTNNLQYKLNDIPEIEEYTKLNVERKVKLQVEDQKVEVNKLLRVDPSFFKVFDYPLQGKVENAIQGPGDAVISEAFAKTLFRNESPLGKTFKTEGDEVFVVKGIVENPQLKSHLDFDVAVFNNQNQAYSDGVWFGIGGYTYAKTAKGTSTEQLKAKLDDLTERFVFPVVYTQSDLTFDAWLQGENKVEFFAKPIADIHLNSKLQFEVGGNGDKQTVITLGIVGLFILIIAAINFMNLSTAKASQRTKEIGVRKVLGSRKSSLIYQFLSESILVTFFAALIAAGLSELFLNLINQQLGSVISVSLLSYPKLILYLFIGALVLGVLSGLYPAFYLSSVKMIPLLKGMQLARVLNMNFAKLMRNGLVVLQFTLSTTLIIAAIFIYGQLNHMRTMDLGFAKEQVFVVKNASILKDDKQAFRNEVLRLPEVTDASFSFRLPADGASNITSTMLDEETSFSFQGFQTDQHFSNTLGLEMKAGEWLNENMPSGDSLVVLNEAAIAGLGLKDPIGKSFDGYRIIVGVVKDFNFGILKEEIGPAMFWKSEEHFSKLAIRLKADVNPTEAIAKIWSQFTNEELELYPLDQNFAAQLNSEKQTADAILVFTILAILVSCLGLFGLAAFTADQRLHEFGIRKVLGAKVTDIVKLFSFDFVKLIVLAFLFSVPIAIWGVNQWLLGFANRISITAGAFIVAGFLAVGIAFLTVLFQSLKTGRLNPVDTLRNE